MKKKGFTLIELLAVIVVLAIIALIATPMVLNTIEKAREGAAKASAETYMRAIEEYMVKSQLDPSKTQLQAGVRYQLSSTKYEVASIANPNEVFINDLINIKGDKPESGYVIVTISGTVDKMEMLINDYPVTCSTDSCEVIEENSDESKIYTVGDIVTLNTGSDTTSEWNIISIDGDMVKLLKSEYYDTNAQIYDDNTWNNANGDFTTLSYENSSAKARIDQYGSTLNLGDDLINIGLITIDELKDLGCDIDNNTCSNAPAWVLGIGWTSSISNATEGEVWQVLEDGTISSQVGMADGWGSNPALRPVITVPKSLVK